MLICALIIWIMPFHYFWSNIRIKSVRIGLLGQYEPSFSSCIFALFPRIRISACIYAIVVPALFLFR